jgi:hypothetical protein
MWNGPPGGNVDRFSAFYRILFKHEVPASKFNGWYPSRYLTCSGYIVYPASSVGPSEQVINFTDVFHFAESDESTLKKVFRGIDFLQRKL